MTISAFNSITATTASEVSVGFGSFLFVWIFIIWGMLFLAGWMFFEKAGFAGWKSLIPFYNSYCLVQMSGRQGWLFLLLFVPIFSLIFRFFVALDIGKAFGKSTLYSVLFLWLFPIVGLLFIGWNKNSLYVQPVNK